MPTYRTDIKVTDKSKLEKFRVVSEIETVVVECFSQKSLRQKSDIIYEAKIPSPKLKEFLLYLTSHFPIATCYSTEERDDDLKIAGYHCHSVGNDVYFFTYATKKEHDKVVVKISKVLAEEGIMEHAKCFVIETKVCE